MQDSNINIGERNIQFAHSFLANEGYSIDREDIGDIYPRKVHFEPTQGKVKVKKLASIESRTLEALENAYDKELKNKESDHGEVELF